MNLRNLTTAALLILHGLFLPCTHCNTYEKVAVRGVVYLGVFQGLHNQRRCVEYAMLMADRLGYAVLLPQFRLNWVPDTADDDRVPFGYLFDVCLFAHCMFAGTSRAPSHIHHTGRQVAGYC